MQCSQGTSVINIDKAIVFLVARYNAQPGIRTAGAMHMVPNDLPGGFHSPREAREGEETCGPYPEKPQ